MKTSLNATLPTFDPGSFRHQILLLEPVTQQDASGTVVNYQVGNPRVAVWGKIDYIRGLELIRSGQDITQTYIKITAWYRPEFAANCRIQLPSGNCFLIQSVENVQEISAYMVLWCLGLGKNSQ